MTNIRDVERQIARMESRAAATPEGAVAPFGLPDNIDDHLTVTYDLMLLAFQADISRVFTFMVAHEGSKLAEFVGKLQATSDGDGTLFDRSLLYFGSGMGNGNAHDRNNPPVLLMGGANGRLKGDRHIVVEDKQPTANMLLGLADLANAEVEQIGKSTGRLSL